MMSRHYPQRKLLLGESLDQEIQQYIRRLRDSGTGISSSIVLAADFLREIFRQWYAQEVGKGLQEGNEVVAVDMRGPAMKELGAQWPNAFYSHMQSHSDIIVNGFRNAGIVEAIEKDTVEAEDPFADCD